MLKKLMGQYYPILAKMSLGSIALFLSLEFWCWPGLSVGSFQRRSLSYPGGGGVNVLAENYDFEMLNKLSSANNKFAFNLFLEIVKSDRESNIFISPSSIAIALSMTYNGARGETQEAIARTLHFSGMSLAEVNENNRLLLTFLESLNEEVELSVANSLWLRQNFDFDSNFIANNQQFYQAEVRQINFDSEGAVAPINEWIEQKTNGKIESIVKDLSPSAVMVLLNAIYFKGNWQQPFDELETKEGSFALADGTTKNLPMMFQSSSFPYFENESFQAVVLPYSEGRASMYVFLPKEELGLAGFYRLLNRENWQNWLLQFDYGEVTLALPRFKTEYEIQLNDVLKSLGMEIAFTRGVADFSGMLNGSELLFISEVKHKTFLEVNEEGSEAAAATGVAIAL
ncbi:MAG: hypothetical protein F6K35_21690, partial [Okeania sp. SIO2H7]|nr:hypothetical protein [Okeania sp. SIO2H7]